MARSSYIWIVGDACGPKIAFTVKHELITFLQSIASELGSLEVYRLPDGSYWDGKRHTLPPENFLGSVRDFLASNDH